MINLTDKEITLENKLIEKLDLMVERLKGTDDNVLNIDGDEGQGKTNIACGICYYVASKTRREFGINNIFFDLDMLIKFASETQDKIILWDEAALGGLSVQWWKANQIKFIQLLMVARKKRHFIVICIPKFYKLNEYLVVDRSIALIHVYSRQNIHKGRFFYYTKNKKELLFDDWKKSHRKSYKKYKSFGGTFQEYMIQIFSEEQLKQYDNKKDKAILSIGQEDKMSNQNKRWMEQRNEIVIMLNKEWGFSATEIAEKIKKYKIDLSRTIIGELIRGSKITATP